MAHIIFDCDGVLVDSEPLSMQADAEVLAAHGVIITPEEAHRRFVGKTFAAMIDEISAEFGVTFPADASAQKDARLLELYEAGLRPVAGVADALQALMPRALSVASNSPAARVAAALRITGLTDFFGGRIVSFEHVARGKHPEDQARALEAAGARATFSAMRELPGLIAAKNALTKQSRSPI
jgi:beta-phosphoglucomutase-like phosphatase (HAD superfamily)